MTKHNTETCTMSFGRKSAPGVCERCDELRSGSAPRAGWQGTYYAKKASIEAMNRNAPKHDCKRSGCTPICTWGDW